MGHSTTGGRVRQRKEGRYDGTNPTFLAVCRHGYSNEAKYFGTLSPSDNGLFFLATLRPEAQQRRIRTATLLLLFFLF